MSHAGMFADLFLSKDGSSPADQILAEFGHPWCSLIVPNEFDESNEFGLLLFLDGSGFFMTRDDQEIFIDPWFADLNEKDPAQILEIPADLLADLKPEFSNLPKASVDPDTFDAKAILKAAALACGNPPEGLLFYAVEPVQDFTWPSPHAAETAPRLISQLAFLLCGSDTSILIQSANDQGRSHVQRREEAFMVKAMDLKNLVPGSYELHQGRAHCNFPYEDLPQDLSHAVSDDPRQLERIFTAISSLILQEIGEPVGWQVTAASMCSDRFSGYFAEGFHDTCSTKDLSAHQKMSAFADLAQFIRGAGIQTSVSEILKKEKCSDHPIAERFQELNEPGNDHR